MPGPSDPNRKQRRFQDYSAFEKFCLFQGSPDEMSITVDASASTMHCWTTKDAQSALFRGVNSIVNSLSRAANLSVLSAKNELNVNQRYLVLTRLVNIVSFLAHLLRFNQKYDIYGISKTNDDVRFRLFVPQLTYMTKHGLDTKATRWPPIYKDEDARLQTTMKTVSSDTYEYVISDRAKVVVKLRQETGKIASSTLQVDNEKVPLVVTDDAIRALKSKNTKLLSPEPSPVVDASVLFSNPVMPEDIVNLFKPSKSMKTKTYVKGLNLASLYRTFDLQCQADDHVFVALQALTKHDREKKKIKGTQEWKRDYNLKNMEGSQIILWSPSHVKRLLSLFHKK